MNRQQYADLILKRMEESKQQLKAEFATPGRVQSCTLTKVLPTDLAMGSVTAFLHPDRRKWQKTIPNKSSPPSNSINSTRRSRRLFLPSRTPAYSNSPLSLRGWRG